MNNWQERIDAQRRFWAGKGPSLILIPTADMPQYDTEGYVERFYDPESMWRAEMRRARATSDWPTDGIPTVRPNLGVVFVPGVAGQEFVVREGQMPWPGEPMTRERIRSLRDTPLEASGMMRLALSFYHIHERQAEPGIAAYHPDTQGIFSLAHLFYGDQIFIDLNEDAEWVDELMEITLFVHARVVRLLKAKLHEPECELYHGHSFPQGIYFPNAGVRVSEDTATMISPRMLDRFVLPYLHKCVHPFGGCFVHFCGRHEYLFEQLCRMPEVRAIDLGNPEKYDSRWLLNKCAESGTVLFSPLPAEAGEDWRGYTARLAGLAKQTGARMILRPVVFPQSRDECREMQQLWHELTS
ncbi:MAG: hypothetical protein U0Q18_24765 [Bryobacteraceae bacterium]